MSETSETSRWLFAGVFLLFAGLILFLHLLPLSTTPSNWAAPDVMLCATYVLALRRPRLVPIGLVALIFLVFDLFLMRPPGLLTAYVVIGAEFLRSRARVNSELPFLVEWALVTGVICAVLLGYRLTLFVTGVQLSSLGLSLQYLLGTVILYPVFVLAMEWISNMRRRNATSENKSSST